VYGRAAATEEARQLSGVLVEFRYPAS